LRESSVDTDLILVDGDSSKSRSFLTSTVVGVGLGGKTCISVNESGRHNNDAATTSVKIWTSTTNQTSNQETFVQTSTSNQSSNHETFVQTTAIIHPTPPS
jgi:hypothetical protein